MCAMASSSELTTLDRNHRTQVLREIILIGRFDGSFDHVARRCVPADLDTVPLQDGIDQRQKLPGRIARAPTTTHMRCRHPFADTWRSP